MYPKQPRTSYPFYNFFYPIVSAKVSATYLNEISLVWMDFQKVDKSQEIFSISSNPQTTDTQWRHQCLGRMWPTAVTENFGLRCDSQPCSVGHFLIMHPLCSNLNKNGQNQRPFTFNQLLLQKGWWTLISFIFWRYDEFEIASET